MKKLIMKFFYYALHTIFKCKGDDLYWFKNKKTTCLKCGRTYFYWD